MSYYLLDHPNPNGPFYYTQRKTCKHGKNQPHLIVIHTAENKADTIPADEGAEAVAKYASTTTRQVSWHYTVDSDSIVAMLPDEYVAFHASSYNTCALGVEQAVQAALWPQYTYEYRTAVIRNAAHVVRGWQHKYGIPNRRITRAQADAGEAGIISHAELDPDRRSDPGVSYPWYYLLDQTGAIPPPLGTPILDSPRINQRQAELWLASRNATEAMISLVPVWFEECATLGVEPSIAIAQAAHETGYGRYGGVVPPSFNNWAGIKTAKGGSNTDPAAHAQFPSARIGIRAQIEHLYLYARGVVPNTVDPRHFAYLAGKAPYLEDPDFTWAGTGYGLRVLERVTSLRATQVPNDPTPAPVPPLTDDEIVAIRRLLRGA